MRGRGAKRGPGENTEEGRAPGRRLKAMKARMKKARNGITAVAWDFRWLPRRYARVRGTGNPRKVSLYLLVVLLVLLAVGLLGALLVQDVAAGGKIFRGVTIAGRPAGGLSSAEATELVSRSIKKPLGEVLVLKHGDEEFGLDPAEIDFKVDVERMVESAYWTGRSQFLLERMFRRLLGKSLDVDVPVYFDYDKKKLEGFVARVAEELDLPPSSARIDVSSGSPVIVLEKDGLRVKKDAARKAVLGALPTRRRLIGVPTESIAPEITQADIGNIVLIKLSEHTLYLFNREAEVSSYIIATGMPEYPTPTGRFHITFKEKNPTWLPTSEWAKDQKGKPVPPGPDNPLGGYWMDLGGGIGIHATPFPKTLGESASHGCIRMADRSAAELYEKVKVGTPVFIVP